MIQAFELQPGVMLRCYRDDRFKQGCLSVQFLRPMRREEAATNALLPALLLRGSKNSPDLRAITLRLDDLYGAAVGAQVRRVGDYQTTGLYCGFMEDAFALPGDKVLEPMINFLGELLFCPLLEDGVFCPDFVESEKRNLILAIESQRNDKRIYASGRLLEQMCKEDSFGIPRLGTKEAVQKITPKSAYDHYQKVLKESPVEIFYVGSAAPEQVAALMGPLFEVLDRNYVNLPAQTILSDAPQGSHTETLDVAQGRLCMGFASPISTRDSRFVAMQIANMIFGGGMTSKLFMTIREAQSLCYDIGSGYQGSKGIVTVTAGIDFDKEDTVKKQVLQLLSQVAQGQFTQDELNAAKQALISQLQGTHDAPGSIEGYYTAGVLSGMHMTPQQYIRAVEDVTAPQVAEAAATLQLHTDYFLKGVR